MPRQNHAPRALALVGLLLLGAGCFRNAAYVDTSDPAITARLKSEIKRHPELEIQHLDIDTHQGVVTISGIINSEDTRYDIVRMARAIQGVQQVIANLVVRQ